MKKFLFFFTAFLFSSILLSPHVFALAENTGLKFSAATDLTGSFHSKDENVYPRRFDVREAEFGVYGPIDHGFEGTLFFAAHNESGEYNLEVHEAYLTSSKLLPNTRFKVGKFFLGIGRLNQFHRHDWPFISTPKAHEIYFAEEAASDTGLQSNILFPFLPIYTELGLGITNGWTYGHSHNQGTKPIQPTHYLHLVNFFSTGENGGLQTGLNYLGRNSRDDGRMNIFGIDLTAKWRKNTIVDWLLQTEWYGRNLRPVGGSLERSFGGYFYTQKNIFGPLNFGIRLDGYTIDTTQNKNLDYSIVPTLSYRYSEFSQFKTSYQLDYEKREHKNSIVSYAIQIQAIFLLGDHPSHDF